MDRCHAIAAALADEWAYLDPGDEAVIEAPTGRTLNVLRSGLRAAVCWRLG